MRPEYAAEKGVDVVPVTVLAATASGELAVSLDYIQPLGVSQDRRFIVSQFLGQSGRLVIPVDEFGRVRLFFTGRMANSTSADGKTFTVRLSLWYPVKQRESDEPLMYVPMATELTATLSTLTGADQALVNDTDYFADTLAAVSQAPFWLTLHSHADNTPAMAEVSTRGAAYLVVDVKGASETAPSAVQVLWGTG